MRSNGEGQCHDPVRAYYDHTWLDYRVLWMNSRNRAMHHGYYDEHTTSHADALVRANEELAVRAGLVGGESVLDAGCGVGGTAFWLAETLGVSVVGITVVPYQVAKASRYAVERGLAERVSFVEMDYTAMAFEPRTFDVVWAQESVCHTDNKDRFLTEAARVLRPGGRLIVADAFRTRRSFRSEDERLLHEYLAAIAVPGLARVEDFASWAEAAGFRDAKVDDVSPFLGPSFRRLHRMAQLLLPAATALYRLGLRTETQHRNALAARQQWHTFERRLWFYGIFTATKPT